MGDTTDSLRAREAACEDLIRQRGEAMGLPGAPASGPLTTQAGHLESEERLVRGQALRWWGGERRSYPPRGGDGVPRGALLWGACCDSRQEKCTGREEGRGVAGGLHGFKSERKPP